MQRNWTYEVDYFLEITRMAFINLVFIIIPGILIRVFDSPSWVYIAILIPLAIFWWFYFRYSLGRFVQIKINKKYSVFIKYENISAILEAYPNKKLYCKVNNKYKKVVTINDVKKDDSILLITVGKTPVYELKKI